MSAERLVPDEREVLMQVAAAAAAASGLDELIERTSEAARAAMGAARCPSAAGSASRTAMRTLINVGDLGPGEERWPEDETYGLDDHPSVDRLLRTAQPYFNAVDDPDADAQRSRCCAAWARSPTSASRSWWRARSGARCGPPPPRARRASPAATCASWRPSPASSAGVVARGEMFSDVSRLAYEDELTGLANRRALDEQLATAAERWREAGTSR